MKKLICFSLWGNDPKYTIGAIKNAKLVKKIYGKEWNCRFYCGSCVNQKIVSTLKNLGSEVIEISTKGNWSSMFWRFKAISDPEVEVMLSRDTDSRLNFREKYAVDSWLKSDKLFHIMRDHPYHNATILGGMWGARKPILKDITNIIENYHDKNGDYWQVDQKFLHSVIWPKVNHTCKIHDEFFNGENFPKERIGYEFVGQVWDENEKTVEDHIKALKESIKK